MSDEIIKTITQKLYDILAEEINKIEGDIDYKGNILYRISALLTTNLIIEMSEVKDFQHNADMQRKEIGMILEKFKSENIRTTH